MILNYLICPEHDDHPGGVPSYLNHLLDNALPRSWHLEEIKIRVDFSWTPGVPGDDCFLPVHDAAQESPIMGHVEVELYPGSRPRG